MQVGMEAVTTPVLWFWQAPEKPRLEHSDTAEMLERGFHVSVVG